MVTAIAGTYFAYDHNGCGNSNNSNTVVITSGVCPTPAPGTAFFICPGALKTLDAGAGYDTYTWSSGQTTQNHQCRAGKLFGDCNQTGLRCDFSSRECELLYGGSSYHYTIRPDDFLRGKFVTLSSSTGAGYLWSTGATGNSINANVSGNYYVTVTDANGCTATSSPVAVTVNPLPGATVSGNATVCKDATSPVVTFTGSGGTAPYTFYYKVNGGTTLSIITISGNSATVKCTEQYCGNIYMRPYQCERIKQHGMYQ
jgi:hypothetical protein